MNQKTQRVGSVYRPKCQDDKELIRQAVSFLPIWKKTIEEAGLKTTVDLRPLIDHFQERLHECLEDKNKDAKRAEQFTLEEGQAFLEQIKHVSRMEGIVNWFAGVQEGHWDGSSAPVFLDDDSSVSLRMANEHLNQAVVHKLTELPTQLHADKQNFEKVVKVRNENIFSPILFDGAVQVIPNHTCDHLLKDDLLLLEVDVMAKLLQRVAVDGETVVKGDDLAHEVQDVYTGWFD